MTVEKRAPKSGALERWNSELHSAKAMYNMRAALAGTGMTPERFAFTAYMMMVRNEGLAKGDRRQLWLGVYAAAECGLSLQPYMQQMHLVPYGTDVTPIVGYKGITYLVAKTGMGMLGQPQLVFQRDVDEGRFRYRNGRCSLDGVVKDMSRPRGILRYAFVVYYGSNGVNLHCCIDRDEILARRERSAGWQAFKAGKGKSSPWKAVVDKDGSEGGDFLGMASKSAIRAFKALPQSADHWGERREKAEAVDRAVDDGGSVSEVLDTEIDDDTPSVSREESVAPAEPGPPDLVDVFVAELQQVDEKGLAELRKRVDQIAPKGHPRREDVAKALNDAARRTKGEI